MDKFGIHPSEKLQKLYIEKPYQIQEPEKAKIIFLGKDANWDINIETHPMFSEFEEYLKDGVKYWQTHDYHTPMLNQKYEGDGRKYHRVFRKLGISSDYAKDICFLELLGIPTYGMASRNIKEYKKMLLDDSNREHLNRIKNLQKNSNITIFIPKGVKTIIDEIQLFDTNASNVFPHTHFSGAISNKEISRISKKCFEILK